MVRSGMPASHVLAMRTFRRFTGVTTPSNPRFLTVANALDIENDNVYNCLVNHKSFQRKVRVGNQNVLISSSLCRAFWHALN